MTNRNDDDSESPVGATTGEHAASAKVQRKERLRAVQQAAILDAAEVMTRLGREGIGTRPFFCPMHQQPVLQRMGLFKGERYPHAERLYRQGLYIPSGLALTEEQMETVAAAVRRAVG